MIQMNCPHCGHHLRIEDHYAGQQGKCKHCQKKIQVPKKYSAQPAAIIILAVLFTVSLLLFIPTTFYTGHQIIQKNKQIDKLENTAQVITAYVANIETQAQENEIKINFGNAIHELSYRCLLTYYAAQKAILPKLINRDHAFFSPYNDKSTTEMAIGGFKIYGTIVSAKPGDYYTFYDYECHAMPGEYDFYTAEIIYLRNLTKDRYIIDNRDKYQFTIINP